MALRLATKYGERILAFTDATIFHAGKGPSVRPNRPNGLGEASHPYGIAPGKYADPFSLSFAGKVATMAPGVLCIYGRQIELDSAMTVADFSSTAETSRCYCTVYAEMAMVDAVTQAASIKLDIRGADYKDFDATGTQEDIYPTGYGTFQAPIARFSYDPSSGEFADGEVIAPFFDPESRYASDTVTESINGIAIGDLADKESDTVLRWKKAEHADTATYGKSFGGVTIGGDLSGLYTVKRVQLAPVSSLFRLSQLGSGSGTINVGKVDVDHLVAIRVYLDGATQGTVPSIKATFEEDDTFWGSTDLSLDDYGKDFMLYPSPGISRAFVIARRTTATLGYFFVEEMYLADTSSGSATAGGMNFMVFDLKEPGSDGNASLSWGIEPSLPLFSTSDTPAHNITECSARLMADFIYQGDADLS